MVQPRTNSKILLVAGLLGVMLLLGLALFLSVIRGFMLAWLLVDLGLISVWLIGSIVYFLFKKEDTKPHPRLVKVDFTQSQPENSEPKINGKIPQVPAGKSKFTVKHG